MEKENKKEEIQSRREFFKKAAKGALPVVGGLLLAGIPLNAFSQDYYNAEVNPAWVRVNCDGCSGTCYGQCASTCSSTCRGNCKGDCSGSARGTQGRSVSDCYYDCQFSCSGACSGTCYRTCKGQCDSSCQHVGYW